MPSRIRFLAFLSIVSLIVGLTGCTLLRVELGPGADPLEEKIISGSGRDKVLLVDITGVMARKGSGLLSLPWSKKEDMVARLAEELEMARQDKNIKALLVRIDSPGGTVAASDLIYHQIKEYSRETKTKVVASMMGTAASGGYYAALAGDKIYALPTTVTGSIGVISLKLNAAGLMKKLGLETETVKSAPLKDMWSPFKPADEDARRIMQDLIDELFQRFKSLVKKERPRMTPKQLERATSAQIFTARQALELGLIDKIGYPEEAFEEAKRLAGLDKAKLMTYQRPGGNRASIYSQGAPATSLSVTDTLLPDGARQFMYIWLPGLD